MQNTGNEDILSPAMSPGEASERSGVRRVNHLPLFIVGGATLLFLVIMALVVLGAVSYPEIGVDLFPKVDIPTVIVIVAVPLAFAQLVGKPVSVPPDPELMGCFGVARLALEKSRAGLLTKGRFDLETLAAKQIECQGEFTCQACDNRCPIRKLAVDGRRYPFGGRCSRFTGVRRRRPAGDDQAVDYVAWRTEELFARRVPGPQSPEPARPRAVSRHCATGKTWMNSSASCTPRRSSSARSSSPPPSPSTCRWTSSCAAARSTRCNCSR